MKLKLVGVICQNCMKSWIVFCCSLNLLPNCPELRLLRKQRTMGVSSTVSYRQKTGTGRGIMGDRFFWCQVETFFHFANTNTLSFLKKYTIVFFGMNFSRLGYCVPHDKNTFHATTNSGNDKIPSICAMPWWWLGSVSCLFYDVKTLCLH